MNNNLQNKIFDNNLPISFSDFTNNHIEKIHKELFNNALKKFEDDRKNDDENFSLDNYRIIEIKDENHYLLPSDILLINKHGFNKEKVSLKKYWNTNYTNIESPYKFNDLLIDEENKKHIDIEDIDYVHGKIKFKNKFNNKTFMIDKSKIDFNLTYKNQLENTFGYLLK